MPNNYIIFLIGSKYLCIYLFITWFVRGNQNSYLPRMIEAIRYINTD